MRKENMYRPVEVAYLKMEDSPGQDWQLTFFQMVYVLSGNGKLKINGNSIPYEPGNLMLLTPNDAYSFDIFTATEFLLIRFNNAHIKEYRWKSIDHVECLLYYASHLSGCILNCKSDIALVQSITSALLYRLDRPAVYDEDLTTHFVNALIVIAARNIARIKPAGLKVNADKRILEIIDYIQANIRCPEKLKLAVIARIFGLSGTYLGPYFKTQCGETIQQFMAHYKVRLIEHRLLFSDMRINEIVDELGFADESHLNKFFKKHKQVSLTGYRKQRVKKKPAALAV